MIIHANRLESCETAERMPLTMSWSEQLLLEAETQLYRHRNTVNRELASAVQGLALLLYGILYKKDLELLLLAEEEEVLEGLAASKVLSGRSVAVLEALAAEGFSRFKDAPGLRGAAFELLHTIRGYGRTLGREGLH